MAITVKTEATLGTITTKGVEALINEGQHAFTFSYSTVGIAAPGTTGITTDVLEIAKDDKVGVKLYVDQSNVIFKPFIPKPSPKGIFSFVFSKGPSAQSKELAIEIARLI